MELVPRAYTADQVALAVAWLSSADRQQAPQRPLRCHDADPSALVASPTQMPPPAPSPTAMTMSQ